MSPDVPRDPRGWIEPGLLAVGIGLLLVPSAIGLPALAAPADPGAPSDRPASSLDGPEDAASSAGSSDAPPGYEMELWCEVTETNGDPRRPYTYEGCPMRVWDAWGYLLGQPALAVNPKNPNQVVFHALHGVGDSDGPSERSRGGSTHSVFTTTTHGERWRDNWYYPSGDDQAETFGEHAALTMDRNGNLYIGSLFARRSQGEFRYHLTTWRYDSIASVENDATDQRLQGGNRIEPERAGAVIETPWMDHAPKAGVVAMTWLERLDDRGRIRLATAPVNSSDPFRPVNTSRIGPCRTATNPAVHEGSLYVGCTNERTTLHRIDLVTGNSTRLAAADVAGSKPRLAVGANGRTVLASATVEDASTVHLRVTHGWKGRQWSPVQDHGSTVSNVSVVVEARVQDVLYRPDTGTLHLVYLERYPDAVRAEPDPRKPIQPRYNKVLVSLHESHGVLRTFDLRVGEAANRRNGQNPWRTGDADEGIYNDLRDSLVQVETRDGTREFLAYGDYGVVGFAEILERAPGIAAPAPPSPTAPQPAVDPAGASTSTATGTTSGSKLLMGVGVAGLSLAMIARILLTRNRTPSKAPDLTGDGR